MSLAAKAMGQIIIRRLLLGRVSGMSHPAQRLCRRAHLPLMHLADSTIKLGGKPILILSRNLLQMLDRLRTVVIRVGLHPAVELRIAILPAQVRSLKDRHGQIRQPGNRA
jgi:hypothetical protein